MKKFPCAVWSVGTLPDMGKEEMPVLKIQKQVLEFDY